MIRAEDIHSLSDFKANAKEHIARLRETGRPEILTVNGEAAAVLLSPAVYDELAREREIAENVAMIQRSMQEIKEGKARDAFEAFEDIKRRIREKYAQ